MWLREKPVGCSILYISMHQEDPSLCAAIAALYQSNKDTVVLPVRHRQLRTSYGLPPYPVYFDQRPAFERRSTAN